MKKVLFVILAAAAAALLLPTAATRNTDGVDIAIVGDILLDRGVGAVISNKGAEYPYLKVRDILSGADIAFGNLECALTRETGGIMKSRRLLFKGDPENSAVLKQAGFDIMNLANNHSMDYGCKGLEDTINILKKAGITSAGGGVNGEEAVKPAFIEKGGMTIGFLDFSAFPPEGYFFSYEKPGIAHVDAGKMKSYIGNAKENCDFLIVSFHWGKEFDHYPDSLQKDLAHDAIDNGADLVIGHHPHVLQGFEEYKGRLVFYSLGNFVFDRQIPYGTDETMIVIAYIFDGRLIKAELLPVRITDCQPCPAAGDDAGRILDRIKLYSEVFDTNFDIKGNSAEYLVGNPPD